MELCSVFGKCGGCGHLNLDYEIQLKNKEEKILNLFKDVDIPVEKYHGITPSPSIYGYRNKMEFSFGNEIKDGPLVIGLRGRRRRYDVYNAGDCRICDEDFNKIVEASTEFFRNTTLDYKSYFKNEGYLRHLAVRKGKHTGDILLNISTYKINEFDDIINSWSDHILNLPLEGKIKSILHTKTNSVADVIRPDEIRTVFGEDHFYDNILDLQFKIGPFSFFQTNTLGAEVLYSKVLNHVDSSDVVYDMYSGTGTIGLLMSKKAGKVYGIEIVKEATDAAIHNAEFNNIKNVEFLNGDVKDVIKTIPEEPDFVVFDPPRAGLHKDVIEFVKEKLFKKIIYVSCNPENLVKNVNDLKDYYKVKDLYIVDMFPHTEHVESVCILER